MLPERNLVAIGAVGANLRSFSFGESVGRFAGIPDLVNLIYREKTVYNTTHKKAINRPVDHTGET